MLCDYGCGKEARFQFKNGKRCCSKSVNSCPFNRIKKSKSVKEAWEDQEKRKNIVNVLKEAHNRPEVKKNHSKAEEEIWKDPEKRKNRVDIFKKLWNDLEYRKNHIEAWNKPGLKQRVSDTSKKVWNRPGLKEKQREFMIDGHASYMNSQNRNPSWPQVKTYENAKGLYPEAILNYMLKIRKGEWFSLDIAILGLKIDIEYDGKQWHKDQEKDRKRDEYLKSLGWLVLRYKDHIPTIEQLRYDVNNIIGDKYGI